jgi:molecular chaperone GrpE (heat shock protein)
MAEQRFAEDDPRHHTQKVRERLEGLIQHLREDVEKVEDHRAQALFETTAEVLEGLDRAYRHFEQKSEQAWR